MENSKEADLEIGDEKSEYVHASSPDAEQNCTVVAGENPFEMPKPSTRELQHSRRRNEQNRFQKKNLLLVLTSESFVFLFLKIEMQFDTYCFMWMLKLLLQAKAEQ